MTYYIIQRIYHVGYSHPFVGDKFIVLNAANGIDATQKVKNCINYPEEIEWDEQKIDMVSYTMTKCELQDDGVIHV